MAERKSVVLFFVVVNESVSCDVDMKAFSYCGNTPTYKNIDKDKTKKKSPKETKRGEGKSLRQTPDCAQSDFREAKKSCQIFSMR